MSVEKTEVETFFGRCRCCLSYGYLKNMWSEHIYEGETEIYGEMLVQCFALTWDHLEASPEQDQICEQCISRLRDATDFKKVVLDSQYELLQQIDAENEAKVKVETLEDEEKFIIQYDRENEADTSDIKYDDTEYTAYTADTLESLKDETEYEEIEYLEEDDTGETNETIDIDSSQPIQQLKPINRRKRLNQPDTGDEPPKKRCPKKLPKSERYKTYKQYSEEDLRKCLEEVRNYQLTPAEASLKYNIPQKTICSKKNLDPKGEQDSNREKAYQLIKEVKAILTFTNATPFKSKNIRYYCAYCSTDGPNFEDPDDLRTHTRVEHVAHRIENIEYAMRPYWLHEIVKLDIDNLLCTVCCMVINNWNNMFKHLRAKHNVVLDQAYNRVIPYVLRTDLKCALCKESFTNYLQLDGHMNAHYNNYVCDDCGDTFVAHIRLKQHSKIHDIGKFACRMCDKIFTLQKYRQKHEESVHEQLPKFKCLYCPERFASEHTRHLHCLDKHKEKTKSFTCELCGQTFNWKPYYMSHMRKKHEKRKPYECTKCDKKFFGNYELKEHNLRRHFGEKNFECTICHKRYVSLTALKQHGRQHKTKNSQLEQ